MPESSSHRERTEPSPELIKQIESMLQTELKRSWSAFRESRIFDHYEELDGMLENFYESEIRNIIPHPAYQLAAQHIGRDMVLKAAKMGISFDKIFPGDFEQSTESDGGTHQIRTFSFQAYNGGELFATVQISFSHKHGQFDFPEPPCIKMEGVQKS